MSDTNGDVLNGLPSQQELKQRLGRSLAETEILKRMLRVAKRRDAIFAEPVQSPPSESKKGAAACN